MAKKRTATTTPATTTENPVTETAVAVIPETTVPEVPAAAPTVVPDPITGVVGELPMGFAALRSALELVRSHADMGRDALAADVATVTAALVAALGDKPAPPVNRGRFTGLRTFDFQNTVYAVNDRADWRFSDRALLIAWRAELATNRCDFLGHAAYVGSTRTAYINGRHGSNVVDAAHRTSRVWPVPAAPKAEAKAAE
jgi:hypothetical protein